MENFERIIQLKNTCVNIIRDPKEVENIRRLQNMIKNSSDNTIATVEPLIFSVFYPIFKSISENNNNFKDKEKQLIVDTLKVTLDKVVVDKLPLFFNIYGFLLFEIYDQKQHVILNIDEDYKLSIVECMTSLAKCMSSSLISDVYVKENAPKLCQMLYVMLETAKNEQYKILRISAITCIMAIAQVLDDNNFSDIVVRNQIAGLFLFFLPGVASQLQCIALSEEKIGHKIPTTALKAWGRIVTLLMQDYNAHDQKINLNVLKMTPPVDKSKSFDESNNWKNDDELKEYLDNTKITPDWYRGTDKKLKLLIIEFLKLTHHTHLKVRLELVNTASLIIENCANTMPSSLSHLLEIIIALSEDSDETVSHRSKKILNDMSNKFQTDDFKMLLDNLEEGFYSVIMSLPRKFNAVDEREQIVALNLLIGYINLFGKHSLTRVLHSTVHLNSLILTLMQISELDKGNITLLEEYTVKDIETTTDSQCSWKRFRHFLDESVRSKIETVCRLLAEYGATHIVSEFLLDILSTKNVNRKEAIFILNELMTGMDLNPNNINLAKNVIFTYTDASLWHVPLQITVDDFGYEHTLNDIKNNILHVCLLVEGIGKIALVLKDEFNQFLIRTLYLVLEKAGSSHALSRTCGVQSLSNIATACGYSGIPQLINKNIDYFAFHVERKLKRKDETAGALSVLGVVMKYSNIEILESTCNIIRELLVHTNEHKEESNLHSHFYVFKIFIECLHRWLNIEVSEESFKTKKQKQDEVEHFKITNVDYNDDFSDDVMEKSAEEMYKEDMVKSQKQLEDEIMHEPEASEYEKPQPPMHVKLIVTVLMKTLHFLPSKNKTRKLLVLEILKKGIEIVKDYEDELLPIVHQIWSPLVDRFKEIDEPLIINYSFQLLVVLSRLSKEFIRSRTAKEVLPYLLKVLDKYSRESYLKDKGSAYRYTQAYKLQMMVLKDISKVLTDLDMLQEDIDKTMGSIMKYVSDKQPTPLQSLAVQCLDLLVTYDPSYNGEKLRVLLEKHKESEYEKNGKQLFKLIEQ